MGLTQDLSMGDSKGFTTKFGIASVQPDHNLKRLSAASCASSLMYQGVHTMTPCSIDHPTSESSMYA